MEQNWELLRRRKNYVRMIDEVGEVKMEATVRTLNSAKLKWKLSRMILFRAHARRENLSEILSGIFLARPGPTNSH